MIHICKLCKLQKRLNREVNIEPQTMCESIQEGTSFVSEIHCADDEDIRTHKIASGSRFIESITDNHLLFAGIAGSVSYMPKPDDDIDIFIITKDGYLWTTILSCFLRRRVLGINEICLSLAFDDRYAVRYFNEIVDGLPLADSLKVIRIHGGEYYDRLLGNSERFQGLVNPDPKDSTGEVSKIDSKGFLKFPIEIFSFLLCAPFLILKSLLLNWSFARKGKHENIYRPLIGLHRFVLESDRYREMDRSFRNRMENAR